MGKTQGLGRCALGVVKDKTGTEVGGGAEVSLTSFGHREDGVFRDAHTQGNFPELLQQGFPKLRLPSCK